MTPLPHLCWVCHAPIPPGTPRARTCAEHEEEYAERRRATRQGRTRVNALGYIEEYDTEKQRYVLQHRLVMERCLGRTLASNEQVHHINHDRTDNRLENLQLVTAARHNELHPREKAPPVIKRCERCGREFSKSKPSKTREARFCSRSCRSKSVAAPRRMSDAVREEIRARRTTASLAELAGEFGVTKTTISRICRE